MCFELVVVNSETEIRFVMKFLNKIGIKCPEIKFDDKRIDNVRGRIINLNSVSGNLNDFS